MKLGQMISFVSDDVASVTELDWKVWLMGTPASRINYGPIAI